MIKFLKNLFKKQTYETVKLDAVFLVSYGEAYEDHLKIANRAFSRKWDAEIFAARQREKGMRAELFHLIVH